MLVHAHLFNLIKYAHVDLDASKWMSTTYGSWAVDPSWKLFGRLERYVDHLFILQKGRWMLRATWIADPEWRVDGNPPGIVASILSPDVPCQTSIFMYMLWLIFQTIFVWSRQATITYRGADPPSNYLTTLTLNSPDMIKNRMLWLMQV